MRLIYEVGDYVLVNGFTYTNMTGGTEVVMCDTECRITKAWEDYECGWRYHAIPIDNRTLDGLSKENLVYISNSDISDGRIKCSNCDGKSVKGYDLCYDCMVKEYKKVGKSLEKSKLARSV